MDEDQSIVEQDLWDLWKEITTGHHPRAGYTAAVL
jgi:hypothetical protein